MSAASTHTLSRVVALVTFCGIAVSVNAGAADYGKAVLDPAIPVSACGASDLPAAFIVTITGAPDGATNVVISNGHLHLQGGVDDQATVAFGKSGQANSDSAP